MIYFGSFFAGLINGLFASGAGQILVFVFVFILKLDTHNSRATSVLAIGITTILTFSRYIKKVDLELTNIIWICIIGFIFGIIGTKLMQKISSNFLNLISGIIIVVLSLYKLGVS